MYGTCFKTIPWKGKEAGVFFHQLSCSTGCELLLACSCPWHSSLTHSGVKFSSGPENALMKRDQEAKGTGMQAGVKGSSREVALVGAFGLGRTEVVSDSEEGSVMGERGRNQIYGRVRDNTEDVNYSKNYAKWEIC